MELPLLKLVSACGLLTLAATTAFAQSSPCPQATKSYGIPGAAASLAGCPFSAVIETESTQSLADGTQIRKKFKGLVYRDSAGRIHLRPQIPTQTSLQRRTWSISSTRWRASRTSFSRKPLLACDIV